MNLFCLSLSSVNRCGFRPMANTVKFIRTRAEFRINERKAKRQVENWCDRKASLKVFHCGVYKHTSEFAFVLGRICAARKEVGCTEVCVSLMHTAGFPRVQTGRREGGGDGDCLLSSELISKPSASSKPSKVPWKPANCPPLQICQLLFTAWAEIKEKKICLTAVSAVGYFTDIN